MTVDEGAVIQWILNHAYAPDDFVLGNRQLNEEETEMLGELLAAVCPNWAERCFGKRKS